MLLLIVVLILVFGLGGGWYDSRNETGSWFRGGGVSVGTILLILLILYLLGYLR